MIIFDANVLLYAVDKKSTWHQVAKAALEKALTSSTTLAFDWNVLLAFLRISTRQNVFERPLSIDEAIGVVTDWISMPNVVLISPTDRHVAILHELIQPLGTAGNLVSDAHLAALAIAHGATLYSFDRDFDRFSGLRWVNLLAKTK